MMGLTGNPGWDGAARVHDAQVQRCVANTEWSQRMNATRLHVLEEQRRYELERHKMEIDEINRQAAAQMQAARMRCASTVMADMERCANMGDACPEARRQEFKMALDVCLKP